MTHTGTILRAAIQQTCSAMIAVLILAGFCLGQISITVSPKTTPPSTKTEVSGSGFSPDAEIYIYFNSTYQTVTFANGSGSFSKIPIEIPASAAPGENWVSALQVSTDTGAQTPIMVETNWPTFGFTASGGRWNPYENSLGTNNVGQLSLKWFYPTGGPVVSSPVVANGVVYVGSNDNGVYALDALTGAYLWSFATQGPVQSSPAVANEVVYVGSGTTVYALNAATGSLPHWTYNAGTAVSSPVVAPSIDGDAVYFSGGTGGVLNALEAKTGAYQWNYNPGDCYPSLGFGGPIPPTSAAVGGGVYTGCIPEVEPSNIVTLFAVNVAGFEIWGSPLGVVTYSAPAVVGNVVYLNSFDGVFALNATNGAQLWANGSNELLTGSPAVANGVVYVGGGFGNEVKALNAANGDQLWSFTTGNQVWSSPAVANGVVYIGSLDNNIYALNATNGAKLWSYTTGNQVESSPTVANGMVYVGSDDNNIYAFSLPQGEDAAQPPSRPALGSLHRPAQPH
jgi:outer membrane protein assembly factor BamB